jgi:2-polyprenyl-3-methyl-5-hydroxy-6-metoxy-1,4-benzoquinol methylase
MAGHDRDAWERRWEQALREHGEGLAERPPNAIAVAELADLPPGRALDAGCGHGAETLWLAARGWRVTAVDFSAAALGHAREAAAAAGLEAEWVQADLGDWAPEPGAFDLVVSIYVHVAGPVGEFVRRMAGGVAVGGTLLLVGYPAAAGQVQVSVEDVRSALDEDRWQLAVAEERPRTQADGGSDAVIRAQRRC